MLVRLLERSGHKCATAANGREAVEAYLANQRESVDAQAESMEAGISPRFDTILMDYEVSQFVLQLFVLDSMNKQFHSTLCPNRNIDARDEWP